jgi:hypothetical protein
MVVSPSYEAPRELGARPSASAPVKVGAGRPIAMRSLG